MENVKLIEKKIIVPAKPTKHKRLFLSNLDLSLVTYQETVSFFDPLPSDKAISFSEACNRLYYALGQILVPYDFVAGRLVPSPEDRHRLEIDCNGAGVVVAVARSESKLNQLGELMAPNPEFRQFIYFLHEEGEDQMELKDKPLLCVQLTQLACGSLALATRFNHCLCDGIAVNDFEKNLAVLTRGEEDLVIMPNPDRTVFKARNPPQINHPHYEYSKPIDSSAADGGTFTVRGMIGYATGLKHFTPKRTADLIYLSQEWIAGAKAAALKDGKLKKCTAFQAVAARIWKARSIAVGMAERTISTMLFPVDCRKRVVPEAPDGFAGNALVPGFARETVKELKEKEDSYIVRKVQEGLERLSDDYVKSGIDWLEVNRGVPCREDSFSLVAWWRLGFEEVDFGWGRHICATPVIVKPGLVILLPAGPKNDGGLNVCPDLPRDQAREFFKILMEN